ncbi:MAG TPA: hypothetical protein VGG40_13535 [Solirubrobacterales bacterium]
MTVSSVRWTCSRCGVSVGRIDGEQVMMPPSWTRSAEELFCLGCSRALAGIAATDAAPAGSSRDDLVRIRRNALVEFEIERDPEAPNRAIARACHTSTLAVAAIRRQAEGEQPWR